MSEVPPYIDKLTVPLYVDAHHSRGNRCVCNRLCDQMRAQRFISLRSAVKLTDRVVQVDSAPIC